MKASEFEKLNAEVARVCSSARSEFDVQLEAANSEIADLKRQLEREELSSSDIGKWRTSYRAEISILLGKIEEYRQQLAESQAREAQLREFIGEVSKQTPEKPDYWSSCSQCERNSSEAEDYFAIPHDDTALREYRGAVIEECAVIAGNSCLVPPDGGSPTVEEAAVSEEAARRIRKLKSTSVPAGYTEEEWTTA